MGSKKHITIVITFAASTKPPLYKLVHLFLKTKIGALFTAAKKLTLAERTDGNVKHFADITNCPGPPIVLS